MSYCSGDCKYLEKTKRHTCGKYGKKLPYMKQTGAISFEAHEQCEQCQTDEYIVKLSKERDYWKNEALKQAAENGERKITEHVKEYAVEVDERISEGKATPNQIRKELGLEPIN